MERLPFDAGKSVAADRARIAREARPDGDKPITVSQLAAAIESSLRAGFQLPIRVLGEVSGFRDRTHWYFDLKDSSAVINCVVFLSAARKAKFTPRVGQEIIATGRIEFYAKSGKVTLIIDSLEPVGAGALELAFKKLCEELRSLGWFAPERKRPIPTFPRRVAVVTSRTGAAWQDVINTFHRRCRAVELVLVDALMQGDKAAQDIASAIRHLSVNAPSLRIDAVLLTRGGGSAEDLWAFNDRGLAEAIMQCSVPVVAAIGHETDTTIAELVADERCSTPTQAAMKLSPDTDSLLEQLDALARRLTGLVTRRVKHDREKLRSASRHPLFSNPKVLLRRASERLHAMGESLGSVLDAALTRCRHRLEQSRSRLHAVRPSIIHARSVAGLDACDARLRRALAFSLEKCRGRLESSGRLLSSVGPRRVMARGYSCTLRQDGRAITSPQDVKVGDLIRTVLSEGEIRSVVGDGTPPRHTSPVPRSTNDSNESSGTRSRRARPQPPNEPELF